MEAAGSSDILLLIYHITRSHIQAYSSVWAFCKNVEGRKHGKGDNSTENVGGSFNVNIKTIASQDTEDILTWFAGNLDRLFLISLVCPHKFFRILCYPGIWCYVTNAAEARLLNELRKKPVLPCVKEVVNSDVQKILYMNSEIWMKRCPPFRSTSRVLVNYSYLHFSLMVTKRLQLWLILPPWDICVLYDSYSTYFMTRRPFWEANRFSASQEFPRILWNPKVFYYAFQRARQLSLTWARSIQSILPLPTSWRSILIL
jgi:hypothetical protein